MTEHFSRTMTISRLPRVGRSVPAHESAESNDSIGEGVSAQRHTESEQPRHPRHRARRNAAQRRAQQQRADTRTLCHLLAGLTSLDSHRGSSLSLVGRSLLSVLQRQAGTARAPPQQQNCMPICRHYAVGRCTYGSMCRFSHRCTSGGDYDNDAGYDNNEEGHSSGDNENEDGHNSEPQEDGEHDFDYYDYVNYDYEVGFYNNSEDGYSGGDNDNEDGHNGEPKDDGEHDVDNQGDDIDDIIGILEHLEGDDRQHAITQLAPNLYVDVMKRLEQHDHKHDENMTSGQDRQVDTDSDALPQLFDPISGECFDDPVEYPSLFGAGLGTAIYDELVLDHNLRKTTWDFLATVNMNKKIARRVFGDEAMNITFNISSDPLPSVPLSAGIGETYVAPAHSGYVGNFASTAIISSGSQPGDFAVASCPDADLQHGHMSNTILEHVRTTLALLPLEKRWDAYVELPYATRKEILDRYPSVMCEEPLSEPD